MFDSSINPSNHFVVLSSFALKEREMQEAVGPEMSSEINIAVLDQLGPSTSDPLWVEGSPIITPSGACSPLSYTDSAQKKPVDRSGSSEEDSIK